MPNAAGLSLGRRYWSNAVFLLESGAGGTAEAEEGEAPGEGAEKVWIPAAFADGAVGFGGVAV